MEVLKRALDWRDASICFTFLCVLASGPVAGAGEGELDKSLEPPSREDEVSPVFKDMGVVQRVAHPKANSLLFSTHFGLEFSDALETMHSVNITAGYALSDFWEIHLAFVPLFITEQRSSADIIDQIEELIGQNLNVTAARPQMQVGAEIVWAFGYGKDSITLTHLVRSDTFLKLGIAGVKYGEITSGSQTYQTDMQPRITGTFGKTYFLAQWLGLRLGVTGSYMGYYNVTQGTIQSTYIMAGQVDMGFIFYLHL